MKSFRKILAAALAALMLTAALPMASFAAGDVDYKIKNTYADVDFDTFGQYKADLHSHTTASDGEATLKEMTEAHYSYDFDIVAVSDHGTNDLGWANQNYNDCLHFFIKTFKSGRGQTIEGLDYEGTTADGVKYTYTESDKGDYYTQYSADGTAGHTMMRVPYAIENNPTSLNNAHVNSWFVPYADGRLGGTSDYITPISNIDALGGLSVINHPGEYTNARDEVYTADAYDTDTFHYKYVVSKFAGLLTEYHTCLGIDVNSKGDSRTRFDRKLYDLLLQRVVPTGRNVYCLATSDAHSVGATYSGYTMMCMPENTVANLKSCMEKGEFFACSKNLGNYDEIKLIADALAADSDPAKKAFGDKLTETYKKIETELADGDQHTKYNAPFDVEAPTVTGVSVDEAEDTITITAEDALLVRWIADGKQIATGETIDLDDYSEQIGSYVRAEIFGEGGIVYAQPFTLEYDGAPEAGDNSYVDFWLLASIVPDTIVRLLSKLPIWGWLLKLTEG